MLLTEEKTHVDVISAQSVERITAPSKIVKKLRELTNRLISRKYSPHGCRVSAKTLCSGVLSKTSCLGVRRAEV